MSSFFQTPGNPAEEPVYTAPDLNQEYAKLVKALGDGPWWLQVLLTIPKLLGFAIKFTLALGVQVLDDVVTGVYKAFSAFHGDQYTSFGLLLSTILEDLLGVTIDGNAMINAQMANGYQGVIGTAGASLYSLLETEFNQGQTGGVQPSTQGAKNFLGYLMGFSIKAGNISVLTEMASLGILKEFREYGEELAKNLGLGRLARRALQPLVQTLVALPLTWQLNQQYRPTKLSATQVIKAWMRGGMSAADRDTELALAGYRQDYISHLLSDNLEFLTSDEIRQALRFGLIDDQAAGLLWTARGYAYGITGLPADYANLSRVESAADAFITDVESLCKGRMITQDQYANFLDVAKITPAEKEWRTAMMSAYLTFHTRQATLAQMETAYLDAFIDLDQLTAWFNRQGYDAESAQAILYVLLQKQQAAAGKSGAAQTSALQSAIGGILAGITTAAIPKP